MTNATKPMVAVRRFLRGNDWVAKGDSFDATPEEFVLYFESRKENPLAVTADQVPDAGKADYKVEYMHRLPSDSDVLAARDAEWEAAIASEMAGSPAAVNIAAPRHPRAVAAWLAALAAVIADGIRTALLAGTEATGAEPAGESAGDGAPGIAAAGIVTLPDPLPATVPELKSLAASIPGLKVTGTGLRGRVLESDYVAALTAYAASQAASSPEPGA